MTTAKPQRLQLRNQVSVTLTGSFSFSLFPSFPSLPSSLLSFSPDPFSSHHFCSFAANLTSNIDSSLSYTSEPSCLIKNPGCFYF